MEIFLEENVYSIINAVGITVMGMITIIYALSIYWNIRTFMLTKGSYHVGFILYLAVACGIMSALYIYLFIKNILGNTEDITIWGTIFIRPAILFLGGAIASISRARYLSLKHGGESWIFPKRKI